MRVTDSASISATAAVSLTINPRRDHTTSSLPAGVLELLIPGVAAAGGSPPYAWSVSSEFWATVLGANGTISGTPLSSGPFSFSAQVTDSAGTKMTGTLRSRSYPRRQITTSSLAYTSGAVTPRRQPGTAPLPGPRLRSLPPGLAVDSGGTIRGTPTAAGSYTFSVRVTDRVGATATRGYSLTINAAVVIETSSLADALIGAPYSQQLRADAGTPPYLWSLTSGALPDGITLDSAGSLSGTPAAVGSFGFTLRVADGSRAFSERQFQITTAAGLIITTAPVLPPATVGLQYGQSLEAAGGRAPYVWSISSGGLPAGVTLNTATGARRSPSAAGPFNSR